MAFGQKLPENEDFDPEEVRRQTGDLLASLNWFHGDDEVDRDALVDRAQYPKVVTDALG